MNLSITIYQEYRPVEIIKNATIELFNKFVEEYIDCTLVDLDSYDGVGCIIIAEHFDGEVKFYEKI